MNKKILNLSKLCALGFVLAFPSCGNSNSQSEDVGDSLVNVIDSSSNNNMLRGCGYNSYLEFQPELLPAEDRVVRIINDIVSFAGLPSNFDVYRNNYIKNAFATIVDGQRVIVYDANWFYNVEVGNFTTEFGR